MKIFTCICIFFLLFTGLNFQISADETNEATEEVIVRNRSLDFHGYIRHPKRRHRKLSLIQLDDGSIWRVLGEDCKKMVKWKKKHLVAIIPTYSWLYPDFMIAYKYVLQNLTLNEVINVYFSTFSKDETFYLSIEEIDYNLGTIRLNDKSCWEVNVENNSHFFSWQNGDRLMIGVNHLWLQEQYPQILINADRNLYKQPFLPAIYKPIQ